MSELSPDQFSGEVLIKALTRCKEAFKSSGAYSGCIQKILEVAQKIEFEELVKTAPQVGSFWNHDGGCQYQVIAIANLYSERADYPPTVVYKGSSNGKIWSRPLSDWHRSMTPVYDS